MSICTFVRFTSCRLSVFLPVSSAPWTQKSHDRLAAVLPVYFRAGWSTLFSVFSLNLSCVDEFSVGFSLTEYGEEFVFHAAAVLRGSAHGSTDWKQLPAGHRWVQSPQTTLRLIYVFAFGIIYRALPSLNRSSWAFTFYLWPLPDTYCVVQLWPVYFHCKNLLFLK